MSDLWQCFSVKNLRYFLTLTALLSVPIFSKSSSAQGSESRAETQSQPTFQLKVNSSLVVVRVVVRDSSGKPVEGLHKEDFKLFDQGKQKTIEQFDADNSSLTPFATPLAHEGALSSNPIYSQGASPQTPPIPASPMKFTALYFDDLNTTDADLGRARDAADRYLTGLRLEDRVGIFTSERMLSNFTNDGKQLRDALAKLHASAHALYQDQSCPTLSDYQAYQITQFQNDTRIDAWKTALDEAYRRGCGGRDETRSQSGDIDQGPGSTAVPNQASDPSSGLQQITQQGFDPAAPPILVLAHQVVAQRELQAKSNLQELRQVVSYCSHMPGQRPHPIGFSRISVDERTTGIRSAH